MRIASAALLGTLAWLTLTPPAEAQRESSRSGEWEAELRWRPRQNEGRVLWIDFNGGSGRNHRRRGDFGFMMKASELSGLAADGNRWSGPARFELRRDAGALRFDGRFEDGWGEGTWSFEPSPRFLQGLDLAGAGDLHDDELLAMLIHDVRTDWVTGLREAGVREIDADDLLAMRIHGVMPDFVRELAGMGYRDLSPDRLVALRIHRVDPEFIRAVRRDIDPTASLNDLVTFRIHKVTPEFVREVSQLGYDNVDPDDLVAMKIHGVTPGFIRSIVDAGLKSIELDDLVAFRIHGVDADYIKEAIGAGVRLDADDLVDSRIHQRRWRRRP